MRGGSSKGNVQAAGYGVLLAFVLLFCLLPLSVVARMAFTGDGGIAGTFGEVLTGRNIEITAFTLCQAIVSAAGSVIFALPGAYLLARYRFPGRSALLALTTVPFVVPPLVLSVGFLVLFGSQGHLNHALSSLFGPEAHISVLYTPVGIVLAHIFLNFPVALRILHARFETMDWSLLRSSELMGAGRVRTFFRVLLPQMRYSLLAAFSLVSTFCFLSFGVIMVIGGMANATIEVEIFRKLGGGNDEVAAGSLLLVQTAILLVMTGSYVLASRKEGGRPDISSGRRIGPARRLGPGAIALAAAYVILAGLLVIGPLAAVTLSSLHPGALAGGDLTLDNFRSALSREDDPTIGATPLGAVENSLLFAFIATAVTVPISIVGAYLMDSERFRGKAVLDVLLIFPLGSSAISLGYGLASGDPGSMLSGTWMIVVLVHALLAYPFCIRAITSAKRELDPSMVRAASLMGASRFRTFKDIELPVLLPGIAVAASFSFAISLGELGATYMVFAPEYATMPVALYQFISGGRDMGAVAAYSVILMAVTGASVFLVDIGTRSLGRFLRWV